MDRKRNSEINERPMKRLKLEDKTSEEIGILPNLPNEVWLQIFGYLPSQDIIWNVERVCKRFHDISWVVVKELTVSLKGKLSLCYFRRIFNFTRNAIRYFIKYV